MNTNQQFPPSSPLLHNEHDELDNNGIHAKDSFDKLKIDFSTKERDDAYLTPDPSSSLGDTSIVGDGLSSQLDDVVSSPTRVNKVLDVLEGPAAKKSKGNDHCPIARKTIDLSNPLSTQNFQNVIHLPLNGDTFKIGRSGLSCSFKINSANKLVSRVHAEIHYETKTRLIVLKCTGYNGLNITIPKAIHVSKLQDREYKIALDDFVETDDEQAPCDRILLKKSTYTNFYMLKDEVVKMPMIEGTVLDFRGDLALLVYNLDPLKLNKEQVASIVGEKQKGSAKLSTDALAEIVRQKKLKFSTHPTLNEIKEKKYLIGGARPIEKKNLHNTIIYKRPSPSPSQSALQSQSASPSVSPLASPSVSPSVSSSASSSAPPKSNPTITPSPAIAEKENLDPSGKELVNAQSSPVSIDESRTPLADITHLHHSNTLKVLPDTTSSGKAIPLHEPMSSMKSEVKPQRTASEETQKKERSHTPEQDETKKRGRPKKVKKSEEETLRSMPREEIDAILSTISGLEDLSNVITNHIAYARILQTPFSSIRELNSVKQKELSKLQLRCILIHHIECIGVIFRTGKDAAGKPLDEEYYYIPENDSDKQRVKLVEDLKGSSSHLRSCRKTHKQYFWKKPKI